MDGLVEKLVDLVNNFDLSAIFPSVESLIGWVAPATRICVLAAPVIMLIFGLYYLLIPPKEANHIAGYRTYFGMGSVEAWRFTQKIAGFTWSAMGLVLTVVMLIQTRRYNGLMSMELLDSAISCILWEIGCIVVCCLGINITTIVCFDRKGNRRVLKGKKR